MKTGKIIKLLRKTEDITQLELADKTGVSRVYLSQIENSKREPSLTFLKSVSKYFNVPLPLLLIGEGSDDSDVYAELRKLFVDLVGIKLNLLYDK
ncbi:MAG TPA: helix-turn-helix transcriptional regulator [Candidatus Deferrimicrobiaceae bacterium]|jgi:transcriptional regulator with XRE-family HTH domain